MGKPRRHPASNVIAVICDCDETLAPNTTSLLLERNGIDVESFWNTITVDFVRRGWDPPQAYLSEILRLMREGRIKQDTPGKMRAFARSAVKPYPGAAAFIDELRGWLASDPKIAGKGARLEGYIISSGMEDLVRGCGFAGQFNGIFGARYATGPDERYAAVRSTVTFTEKTKFLYAINKGIREKDLRSNPYLVNNAVPRRKRRVPFENMIYIGDGPSDVPCFSAVRDNGGHCMGIIDKKMPKRAYELARGRRTNYGIYSGDFRARSDLRLVLKTIITEIGERMQQCGNGGSGGSPVRAT